MSGILLESIEGATVLYDAHPGATPRELPPDEHHALVRGILDCALLDLFAPVVPPSRATSRQAQLRQGQAHRARERHRVAAYHWLLVEDGHPDWPGSLVRVCEVLAIDVGCLRRALRRQVEAAGVRVGETERRAA